MRSISVKVYLYSAMITIYLAFSVTLYSGFTCMDLLRKLVAVASFPCTLGKIYYLSVIGKSNVRWLLTSFQIQ